MKTHTRLLALNLALLLALLLAAPALAAGLPSGVEPVFYAHNQSGSFTPGETGYYHVFLRAYYMITPVSMTFYGPDKTIEGNSDATFLLCADTSYSYYYDNWGWEGRPSASISIYRADADGNALPKPAPNIAYPSTQTVDVDGKKVEFQCYALKDANGNDTNYIKLRDLADILNGSAAQFQVGWDGNITITTKTAYTKNGTEQNTPFSGQRTYEKTAVKTLVDGKETSLDTFQLKDDNGGGYTYYKLRDLGKALGITVDWSGERGIFIETR